MFSVATANVGAGRTSSDRVLAVHCADRVVVVVADGAGGTTRGATAAEAVIETVKHELAHQALDHVLTDLLTTLDSRLAREGGETTAVIAIVTPEGVHGVSVGDSEAYLFGAEVFDLTRAAPRKRRDRHEARRRPGSRRWLRRFAPRLR